MYRIDVLLKQKNHLFHTRDLALLWGITRDNTLYTTIKRYVDRGILIPIQKGLYATVPVGELDPLAIGAAAIHTYCYVSCEYILAQEGIIFQSPHAITFVGEISRTFTLAGHMFLLRKLRPQYLFCDSGIFTDHGVLRATVERAVADILYFNPRYHLDNRRAIDWRKVQRIQKEVGYL